MKNIRMSSDWLRVALLVSEISCSTTLYFIGSLGVVCKTNKLASQTFTYDHHVFEAQAILFSIKGKQSIIVRLETH